MLENTIHVINTMHGPYANLDSIIQALLKHYRMYPSLTTQVFLAAMQEAGVNWNDIQNNDNNDSDNSDIDPICA